MALKKLEAENEGKELMIAEMNEEQSKLYKERQALIDHCKVQWQEAKKKVYIPWIFRFQGYTHQQNFSDSMTKIQAVDQTLQKLQKSSQEVSRHHILSYTINRYTQKELHVAVVYITTL